MLAWRANRRVAGPVFKGQPSRWLFLEHFFDVADFLLNLTAEFLVGPFIFKVDQGKQRSVSVRFP
jgi:hypothetical protein